jgi:hypothetical protein
MAILRSRLVAGNSPGSDGANVRIEQERDAGGVAVRVVANVAAADQSRPIDPETIASVVLGTKRKPENKFLTASIRKAKTAMLRIATSPIITGSPSTPNSSNNRIGMRSWSVGEIYNNGESPHTPLLSGGGGKVVMKTGYNNYATPTRLLMTTTGAPSSMSSSKLLLSASPRTIALGLKNVLEWLDDDAPSELLPKILSFCGSRKMHALSRVNKKWNAIMKDEYVWRTLCEDTHKVRVSRHHCS